MTDRQATPKRGGAWTKVVIFVSLYFLLLQSLIEWVLVLYLYGNRNVDSKMAPSLILALIASFFTVPLVVLHSFLAWQYNRVLGSGARKTMLHTICTYILRFTITVWLAASVAGLVVASQQAPCLPDSAYGSFWNVGVSCALHRAVVIVSVVSFLTVCLYFCSRELCERPYDISLLGVYKPQRSSRDDSIFSASSLDSERGLKNDILCICRRPDVTYGRNPYMASSDVSEKSGWTPTIEQPTPIRPTSFLQLTTDADSGLAEHLSRITTSPGGTLPTIYPSGISRTPTFATTGTIHATHDPALPELPGGSDVEHRSSHMRQKSSVSSLRRFLPKATPVSAPLSADPQIRALADPATHVHLVEQGPQHAIHDIQGPFPSVPEVEAPHVLPESIQPPQPPANPQEAAILTRSITVNSAEAPEVVTPEAALPAPLNVRRSNTTHTAPIPHTPHFHHHPNKATRTRTRTRTASVPSSWATLLETSRPTRTGTMRTPRQQQFEPGYIPRYTQSQRFPRNRYPRNSLHRNMSSLVRGNDVERHYPSIRRPRSSTCGSRIVPAPGHLDCIRETGASIDEPASSDPSRGTNRTSVLGH
ncbi:hypothetical protein P175DRAFT_0436779 [Aspergillus ochraceoroseus IBT 24754]|uniref:Uncharacterized protein n=3 Tax=Aspergillus subgen. Nidulantes TaxID=2720870 RepID=A0A0F8X1Y1_9EURO|nr:uncharacterized protein P175DRAFT_0436779 [Aspergillus ochraceoroseus IBT 24754]KKK23675.1 hypothetical protein ARAM_006274 [Aspergillus rambellii]PTU21014.1 hypothetical protein P175DRAFT_0436779 [Aspergillus ochraceoroseus IBT 24754]